MSMTKEEVKSMMKEVLMEEIVPMLLKMLNESEARINSTNSMVCKFAEASSTNMALYDKHLASLERSRDSAQKSVEDLIKANLELTRASEKAKEDCRFMIQDYKDELHSAKDLYNNLLERYDRLNEKVSRSGKTTEAKATVELKREG